MAIEIIFRLFASAGRRPTASLYRRSTLSRGHARRRWSIDTSPIRLRASTGRVPFGDGAETRGGRTTADSRRSGRARSVRSRWLRRAGGRYTPLRIAWRWRTYSSFETRPWSLRRFSSTSRSARVGVTVDVGELRAARTRRGRVARRSRRVITRTVHATVRPHTKLFAARNCLITPHIAWASQAARKRLMGIVVENVRAFLAGTPQNVVN